MAAVRRWTPAEVSLTAARRELQATRESAHGPVADHLAAAIAEVSAAIEALAAPTVERVR